MRKLIFITIVFTFLTAPALADQFPGGNGEGWDGGAAMWERKSGYYAGNGGEFTIYRDGEPGFFLDNSDYAASTKGLTWTIGSTTYGGPQSFQTFCMETGEYIHEPMRIWVSEASIASPTVYGSGSHAWKGGTNIGDDLDAKTAYLYTQFAKETLSNYAYSGTVNKLNRSQTAGALQRLIWATEDEGGGDFTQTFQGITLNLLQQNLITSWNTGFTNSGWTGIGNVRVLQTFQLDTLGKITGLKQDQLYLVPVPGAVLLGMLGLSVAGLKLRKSK